MPRHAWSLFMSTSFTLFFIVMFLLFLYTRSYLFIDDEKCKGNALTQAYIYPDMMFTSAKYLLHTLVLLSFFLFNCSGQIHAITLDNIRVFDYTEFGSLSQVNERSFQVIMASRRRGTAKLFQITKVLGKKSHDSEDHIPGILASSREEFDIEFSRMKS